MGFFDWFRRGTVKAEYRPDEEPTQTPRKTMAVGASETEGEEQIQSFSNSNITYNGELVDFDYTAILKDKQNNIVKLYQLADYYSDADAIVRGIIKHVYVPFSTN